MQRTSILFLSTLLVFLTLKSCAPADYPVRVVLNPYEQVDWSAHEAHKAALHVHTLQSDGYHMLDEVVRTYSDRGFSILAITDHDIEPPNAQVRWGRISEEEGTHLPGEPKPENYPSNTTWPWADYEAPSPEELGLVGIEGAELSYHHHMNSFFSDYGAYSETRVIFESGVDVDEQAEAVRESGGYMIFNHPGLPTGWWTRSPMEFYITYFDRYPDVLIGMEVTNAGPDFESYDEGLWNQLLARFMPDRPIWGFGTDDMHNLANVRESHTVFLLPEQSEEAVRTAMRDGRFYFTKSQRRVDLREDDLTEFPVIERIAVDNRAGTITIEGSGYDRIVWISAPASLETVEDYETSNEPWARGEVVHEGAVIDFRNTEGVGTFLRAELLRDDGEHLVRTFTNPFGLSSPE